MKSILGLSSLVILAILQSSQAQEISDGCLGCICHASSGCNANQGCTDAGVCGPFLITWAFWKDAGQLSVRGSTEQEAYSKCTTDIYCASETVRAYSRKYAKDCNNDGVIDCEDFTRIHKLGPGSCGDSSIVSTSFYREYQTCKAQVQPQ